jgi:AcrR family transcriptional regulator
MPRSARRKQLLAAAQEVFVALGYHAAAMDDIAERAGVSKPVLYQHFPGKLDLYIALVETQAEELVGKVRGAMAGTPDNRVRVEAAIRAYVEFVGGDGDGNNVDGPYRLLFASDLRNDPSVNARVHAAEQSCIDAVAEAIIADTQVCRERAELLSSALIGASQAGAQYWLHARGAVAKEEAIGLISALLWRGIGGFPRHDELPPDAPGGTD